MKAKNMIIQTKILNTFKDIHSHKIIELTDKPGIGKFPINYAFLNCHKTKYK